MPGQTDIRRALYLWPEAGGRAMDFPAMHAAYWAGTCPEWVWEVLSQMRAEAELLSTSVPLAAFGEQNAILPTMKRP